MPANTWVKVVGFTDGERHSLNTLFRLSERRTPAYALWTPEQASQPHVLLIDLDSYEGGLELESPRFNPNLKFICVGDNPPPNAWRTFARPVDWTAMVQALDALFVAPPAMDIDLNPEPLAKVTPPGVKSALLVGLSRSDTHYLRARLALAGITEVEDVSTGEMACQSLSKIHYDVVVISLELIDTDPWALVENLKSGTNPTHSVIVATDAPSWRAMVHAEHLGCTGLLEIPFMPQQVLELLQKV